MRPEIVKIHAVEPEPSLINYVAERIRQGAVVGLPTDSFYGLAVDPYNLHAVERVYEIKGRERNKPLSLLIDSVEQAEELAYELPDEFNLLAEKFWPGPLTIILKAAPRLPLKVTANSGNIAVRMPDSPVALAVVRAMRCPVTATSANLAGEAECTTAAAVVEQLGDLMQLVVDGGTTPRTVPTTIVNLSGDGRWSLQREGAIPLPAIEDLLGDQ
ncbi:MAG: L-threonylcarbamoyladenylate synthase [Acidobacteriota bacterium]|nr:L-threonylcarbamoyladenylate synthase [Acidobacteriota bacterium]